jgi:hypothetical protein
MQAFYKEIASFTATFLYASDYSANLLFFKFFSYMKTLVLGLLETGFILNFDFYLSFNSLISFSNES